MTVLLYLYDIFAIIDFNISPGGASVIVTTQHVLLSCFSPFIHETSDPHHAGSLIFIAFGLLLSDSFYSSQRHFLISTWCSSFIGTPSIMSRFLCSVQPGTSLPA